jgi:hypothetical protein
MKDRIVIYDFDGTIFHSPEREQGETIYFEATGELYPYEGWWGRKETLTPPIVPQIPDASWYLQETLNAHKEDSSRKDTEVILMTGRAYKLRHRILEICDIANLKFDRHFFKGQPGQKGTATFDVKRNFIQDYILHPNLKFLEIWEDRPNHVCDFVNIAKYWKSNHHKYLEQITVHDVKTGKKLKI